LQKSSINFEMSVCLSVHTYQCGSHCMDIREIWYWGLLWQ